VNLPADLCSKYTKKYVDIHEFATPNSIRTRLAIARVPVPTSLILRLETETLDVNDERRYADRPTKYCVLSVFHRHTLLFVK